MKSLKQRFMVKVIALSMVATFSLAGVANAAPPIVTAGISSCGAAGMYIQAYATATASTNAAKVLGILTQSGIEIGSNSQEATPTAFITISDCATLSSSSSYTLIARGWEFNQVIMNWDDQVTTYAYH